MADNLEFLKQLNDLQRDLNIQIASAVDFNDRIRIQEEYISNQKRIQTEQERLINESRQQNSTLTTKEKEELNEILNQQRNINTQVEREVTNRQRALKVLQFTVEQFKIGWDYLMASDKIIKSTILNLGMSGAKAELMRISFEKSVGIISSLGGTMEDIQAIQEGFADETGRARDLTAQMLIDVTKIGKGTGLGIEAAAKLGAQFEYMGLDVKKTMDYVQGVVETSERMGVNTTKVLKNINDNFKKLSTFTFVNGVKAFGEMAMYAEKTRISMTTALDVAEATRNLENVIELGANLQVMGGEFAKMDPFQWLFLARNEPEKMQEKISEMTKGIYTLRKNSDGTFEKFISPVDVDRLTNVAKSLGIAKEEMFEIAQRRLDISIMDKQLAGKGLTKREKELIQGAATMNTETGRFQVSLAGTMVDISKLTSEQAKALESEQKTLEQRAKDAQTFEEAFRNTVNALKGALLPILRGINTVLGWIRPIFDGLSKLAGSGWGGVIAAGGILLAGAAAWRLATNFFTNSIDRASSKLPSIFQGGGGGQARDKKTGRFRSNANAGKGMMRGGIGIGAAAVGVGAGIGVAAVGIGELAKAIKDVDVEKLKVMNGTIAILGGTMALVLIPAMFAFATAGTAAAPALLAFGAAALGIGAGIGAAAWGIGEMAKGLSVLVETSKDAGDSMINVGKGVAYLSGAMLGFAVNPIGFITFAATMKSMAKNADAIAKVGDSFKNIGTVLTGSKEDFIAIQNAVESISKINIKGGGMLADLANILKNPLKVEFSDSKVAVVSDITLNIDGQKFMQKVYRPIAAIQRQVDAKLGHSTGT